MLVKLTKQQCSQYWPMIKESIIESMPEYYPINQKTLNNFLRELLIGSRECWIEFSVKYRKLRYVLTLTFYNEETFEIKHLYLSSMKGYSYQGSHKILQAIGIKLMRYAKSCDCDIMSLITNNDNLIEISKSFGAYTNRVFANLPLK